MPLISLLKIDNFDKVKSIKPSQIDDDVIFAVRDLHEVDEIEPWIQSILYDTNRTPHGPAEIVDILTHKMTVNGVEGNAALILKGRSYRKVRPKDVSHQIYRLETIDDLSTAILAASGDVLDAVKQQFISTASRLNCNYGIWDAHDLARLFVAFGFMCPRDGEKIRGGKCSCGYSPVTRTSNILQKEALEELKINHVLGKSAGAVILPTGAGKTSVAVRDIKSFNSAFSLYVAHTHEILEDAEVEFLRHFTRDQVKRFEGRPSQKELRKVNLITIQSLNRNLNIFDDKKIEYMVIDEFHHASAKSYRNSIDRLTPKFLLGLTATPFRGDRKDVLELCDGNVIVNYELRAGIDKGVLCPYHYYGCFDNIDYSKIEHNGQSYAVRDLEKALIVPERDRAIVKKWREKANDKSTIAFCCSHLHAKRVAESFMKSGVTAEVYLSDTPKNEREEIRQNYIRGQTKIICAVDILNEGIDLPMTECLLFLRPTESKRIFFQQLGRGLRHHVGKHHCTVIDFIGNFKNAYKIVEYQMLDSAEDEYSKSTSRSIKEILNLPDGCKVEFDEKVIDVFGSLTLDPKYATRHNIGKILIYKYKALQQSLGRMPSKKDVDRYNLLASDMYVSVFGSWKEFQRQYSNG